MNKLAHAAGRKVFARIVEHELGQMNKNRQGAYQKII